MTEIYILRHGIAVASGTRGYPNDDRPLTEEGIKKMKEAADGIAQNVPEIDLIVSSPLVRAHDTAKIAAGAIRYNKSIKTTKHLMPGAGTDGIINELADYKNVRLVMLVGHNPHLEFLASALLGAGSPVIEFKKGGMCRIDIDALPPEGPGRLIWHLTPKQLWAFRKR